MAKKFPFSLAMPPFNEDPSVIGYWARVHNFKLQDFLSYDSELHPVEQKIIMDLLVSPEAQQKFNEAWEHAEQELYGERFEELLSSLRHDYIPR